MNTMEEGRHIFPGNNTPLGFYSYYHHIIRQEKATKIICIKGGPGTGKSTFMKNMANEMSSRGYNIEYMHCSSDPESLDGIVITELKIALLDATSPHAVDPKNPGVVDEILYLGDFWNEKGLRNNKTEIMKINIQKSMLFKRSYRYLEAAKCIYDDIVSINNEASNIAGIYKEVENIVIKEFGNIPISNKIGNVRKLFASAISPDGVVNYLETIINKNNNIYIIKGRAGILKDTLFSKITEIANARGLDVEAYYCPIDPENKIEHIVINELSLAFTTSNKYHSIEVDTNKVDTNKIIDLNNYIDNNILKQHYESLKDDENIFEQLLNKAIYIVNQAKEEHSKLEKYYIPNMDFEKVQLCYEDTLKMILNNYDE